MGAKRGDITREEGFGWVSEDTQRLKKNYCYQVLSVFAFTTVHNFLSPISDCLPPPPHTSLHQYKAPLLENASSVSGKNQGLGFPKLKRLPRQVQL